MTGNDACAPQSGEGVWQGRGVLAAPCASNGDGRDPCRVARVEQRSEPLFSFGAIADVQYADHEDGWNYAKTHTRYYRGGLVKLRDAIDVWLRDENHRFVLQLGDVIDGCNRKKDSEAALRSVKLELDRLEEGLPLGVLNSLGNHELYNFPKRRWAQEVSCSSRAKAVTLAPCTTPPPPFNKASLPPSTALPDADPLPDSARHGETGHIAEERFYYSFCPHQSYRVLALDTYDVNAIRGEQDEEEEGSAQHRRGAAEEILSEQNPNEDKDSSFGMEGEVSRFVRYNGGIGAEQLLWLERQLDEASRAGQRVIAFGHVPIHPEEPSANCLVWNYKDVLEVMHKFDCVVVYLSGHRHRETYCRDVNGVHHISLAAALEALPHQEAFASVDVYADRLELRGHGVVESRTLDA